MDAPPPHKAKAVNISPLRALEDLSETQTEITVAERVFPNTKYTWYYPKSAVIILRMELDQDGRSSELRTEMNSKSSKLILSISPLPEPEQCVKGKILK